MNHDEHHDDYGGLRRDLLATGAAMDRRGLLRLAARFGVGLGALAVRSSEFCRKLPPILMLAGLVADVTSGSGSPATAQAITGAFSPASRSRLQYWGEFQRASQLRWLGVYRRARHWQLGGDGVTNFRVDAVAGSAQHRHGGGRRAAALERH